jgi:hypothetical protein
MSFYQIEENSKSTPIKRKRSAKRTEKLADAEQIVDEQQLDQQLEHISQQDGQIEPGYTSRLEEKTNSQRDEDSVMSPPPHEAYKNSLNQDGSACNIYNCSPIAVEKRRKMISKRDEMLEFQRSDILPKLLEMNQKSESFNCVPLLLTKSLSEG